MDQDMGERQCIFYEKYIGGNTTPKNILIQAVDDHDLALLEEETELIRTYTGGEDFLLVAFRIREWNKELSPWQAPAAFGDDDFGAGAEETLEFILQDLIPELEERYRKKYGTAEEGMEERPHYYLGGYSLAGLFALWSAFRSNRFDGVAGVSPSVWFPEWDAFMETHSIQTPLVYLSLGDKEERTRNPVMAKVGDNIRRQKELLQSQDDVKACALEWNQGNHFKDSQLRCAKGFAWLLQGGSPAQNTQTKDVK